MSNDKPDKSKRRFIQAGLVSAPVIVTLAARPAWAQEPGPTGYVRYDEGLTPVDDPFFPTDTSTTGNNGRGRGGGRGNQ